MSDSTPKAKRRAFTPIDDVILSIKLMRCVKCGGVVKLDLVAKLVYARLAWRKREQMKEREMAEDLGVSVDAIADATRRLERCGLLQAVRNRGLRRWNAYRLTPVERIGVAVDDFGPGVYCVDHVAAPGRTATQFSASAKCGCSGIGKLPMPTIRKLPMHDPQSADAYKQRT